MYGLKKNDGCVLRKAVQTLCEEAPALNLGSVQQSWYVINQSQKRLINHNIHEAAATEWE